MCAGVQNVSRPMVRCHEMSQMTPTTAHVAATNTAVTYHGTFAITPPCRVAGRRSYSESRASVSSSYTHSIRGLPHGGIALQGTNRRATRFQPLARAARRPRHPSLDRDGLRVQRVLAPALPCHRHHAIRPRRLEDQHPPLDVHAVLRLPRLLGGGVPPVAGARRAP